MASPAEEVTVSKFSDRSKSDGVLTCNVAMGLKVNREWSLDRWNRNEHLYVTITVCRLKLSQRHIGPAPFNGAGQLLEVWHVE